MTSKTRDLEHTYEVEELKVGSLLIDPRVQRDHLEMRKVDHMVANYNPDAMGVIHVSRRKDGDYIIDGWHRTETKRRITENQGTIVAHVFKGLTLVQEARMFYDLNYASNPNPMVKHKVMVSAQDEQALRIEDAVHAYGWAIHKDAANGHVNAIIKLYALDAIDQKLPEPLEPSVLRFTFLVLSRAWLNDKHAAQGVILDGLAHLYLEHRGRIDVDHLVDRLKNYQGGPRRLMREARNLNQSLGGKISMHIAWIITEAYNKGKRNDAKSALPPWRKRR